MNTLKKMKKGEEEHQGTFTFLATRQPSTVHALLSLGHFHAAVLPREEIILAFCPSISAMCGNAVLADRTAVGSGIRILTLHNDCHELTMIDHGLTTMASSRIADAQITRPDTQKRRAGGRIVLKYIIIATTSSS